MMEHLERGTYLGVKSYHVGLVLSPMTSAADLELYFVRSDYYLDITFPTSH